MEESSIMVRIHRRKVKISMVSVMFLTRESESKLIRLTPKSLLLADGARFPPKGIRIAHINRAIYRFLFARNVNLRRAGSAMRIVNHQPDRRGRHPRVHEHQGTLCFSPRKPNIYISVLFITSKSFQSQAGGRFE